METSSEETLRSSVMKGDWTMVEEIYRGNPQVHYTRINHSGDTALHMAVHDGDAELVETLLSLIDKDFMYLADYRGNNPLHLAAKMGNEELCFCIASKQPDLVSACNEDSETPLFLAARHGRIEAYIILHNFSVIVSGIKRDTSFDEIYSCGKRNSDGSTTLHCAIDGGYFDLAYQIIVRCPGFIHSTDQEGYSPLHLLASKHSAFRSSSCLTWFQKIIYPCIPTQKPMVKEGPSELFSSVLKNSNENANPLSLFMPGFQEISSILSDNPETRTEDINSMPSEYSEIDIESLNSVEIPRSIALTIRKNFHLPASRSIKRLLLKAVNLLMSGVWSTKNLFPKQIVQMKENHLWSIMIMELLLKSATSHDYGSTGGKPTSGSKADYPSDLNIKNLPEKSDSDGSQDPDEQKKNSAPPGPSYSCPLSFKLNEQVIDVGRLLKLVTDCQVSSKSSQDSSESSQDKKRRKETPILIAARSGIKEIVSQTLELFPVAIHDVNSEGKNLMLLAVENRQPHVCQFLLRHKDITNFNLFNYVDNEGNNALHLAAMLKTYRPWLAPDAVLQMQWEIKWYEFIKESAPRHFVGQLNSQGKTPEDIFMETHAELVKNDSEWLAKTSQSCTIVAALIATVAFATSSSVPGGVNGSDGEPVLRQQRMFEVFAISSHVALCFSLTAVIMFLAILSSRHQAMDFGNHLPRKLLIGLTALFVSIASMLVSFCFGHFFVVRDVLRDARVAEYLVAFIPVAVFTIAQFPLYFKLFLATVMKEPERGFMLTS